MSPELLRAWETRYGLVEPERTPGGLRLYSEGGRAPRAGDAPPDRGRPLCGGGGAGSRCGPRAAEVSAEAAPRDLDHALAALDEPAAQATLDQHVRLLDLETALAQVILPFLHDLGERWAAAERSVDRSTSPAT